MKDNKHQFALFVPALSAKKNAKQLTIADKDTVHRITHVLRLNQGNTITLFDREHHAIMSIDVVHKKEITFSVQAWNQNKQLLPHITVFLPVLKKDALESAIYACAALGANTLQLITTEKTRKWSGDKELERMHRIIVAAAEQSKQFAFTEIKAPCTLAEALQEYASVTHKLFADPQGSSLRDQLSKNSESKMVIMVGPEGDLTTQEKELIKKEFIFCRLTPTILKSEQALALLLGALRLG